MTTPQISSPLKEQETRSTVVNDFCITVATINGSGSATANGILLRALFTMGIPVSGKNIFPSNIQGLPTWYSIRLSRKGYLGRIETDDVIVAMNPATFLQDLNYLVPGGVLFYDDSIKMPIPREDIVAYPMPVKQIVRQADVPANLRDYVANMVYVGVVAQMLNIDLKAVQRALTVHFKGKQKAIDSNWAIIKAAADWAAANLEKRDPYWVEPMPAPEGRILIDGNTAGALGAIYGGFQLAAWYPITPASSFAEALGEYAPELRKDPITGKHTFAIIQAEDELAAAGMAIGAGWAGLRAMASTSGPGFSLMAEYLGLAYYAEVPVVIWDIQRVGPSTGLPTRTAQGDLTFAYFLGHGDTQYVILLPGNVNECFEMGWRAFDIAERLQAPVLVLSDLDLGMNMHIGQPFEYPDAPMDRGKVLWEEDLERFLNEHQGQWGRYLDVDGDGIPYRTLPGNTHPRSAYFARGTGHDEFARYSEEPEVWERVLNRIARKMENARNLVPKPVIQSHPNAEIGIIAYGSTEPAIQEARDLLAAKGVATDFLRLRALPFTDETTEFLRGHSRLYVVELNRDGQMRQLLAMSYPEYATKLRSVAHVDGLPLTARWVVEQIAVMEGLQ
ncbi:2-oxoacid:acceptor oxidoreductase subunit alpha [Thermanaerothrix sp.]|jgi:2-oxoglutarate ferredoxin oxidoreductase subunit alpha|uniref:2-oxoacid:acceptor oxidoreductase subunit alpha n=1 Tax=Thermanaerothrix sp. TaxID=2972675 RepID=UPI002ADE0065|nr:2-oxoacid:acceptor oxidoreductase subunit alpha [Thermanaerothrix sp.]